MAPSLFDYQVRLARLCSRVAWRSPTWVQGPGGNVSVKGEWQGRPIMLIKASGTRLDQVTPSRGMAVLDRHKFFQLFEVKRSVSLQPKQDPVLQPIPSIEEAKDEALYASALTHCRPAALVDVPPARPSMETGFHLALDAEIVVHIHSLAAVLMAHQQRVDPAFRNWLASELREDVVFLPPLLPGIALADACQAHAKARVIILANHGVILGLQSMRDIGRWEKTEKTFMTTYGYGELLDFWQHARHKNLDDFVSRGGIPMRPYLPDTAVFADEIQRSLVESQNSGGVRHYTLAKARKDMVELWAAEKLLFQACPELTPLADTMISRLRSLPTEIYRLNKAAS